MGLLTKRDKNGSARSVGSVYAREQKLRAQSRFLSHLSATLVVTCFVAILAQFELAGLQGILIDGFFRLQNAKNPHPDILLVAYNRAASHRYGGSSRIPPLEIARVLEALRAEAPQSVAIIAPINEKNYTDAELGALTHAFAQTRNLYVGFTDDDSLGKPAPGAVAGVVRYLPGFVSRDTFSYGTDSVSRRVMIAIEGFQSVYAEMARSYRQMDRDTPFTHTYSHGKQGTTLQAFIRWQGPAGTYLPWSSEAVAERKFPPGTFANKIVLIGTTIASSAGNEFILTPYSREPFVTSYLEGAAHSLATLLRDDGLYKAGPTANFLLALLVGAIVINLVLALSPGRGILAVLGVALLLAVAGYWALIHYGFWVDMAHPLVVVCVSYYIVVPYRLLNEYRKRWHYQEKSELMAQLEQLKTNFLSLVSHDLKTPIARIQGNAELMMGESNIDEKQKRTLSGIISTTEDLSQYVETILDLTRIESAQIPLQKSTKDINSTIQEAVESKRFLAADKNITISTDLEPLFSFKYDVKLIRRVIANLVENAIKYSPPNSHISVNSKEAGQWIQVSIHDEGVGIPSEEQEKVFEKYYRCTNKSTDTVKGTGLGLYLVKYFVELHRGMVDLQSEQGKGSVFTISLPV